MTDQTPRIPPLVVELHVAAEPAHAFDTWVYRTALWWPPGHSRSGRPERIVFDPFPGGRVYERDPAGVEHEWATVLEWDPPRSLRLRWHHVFPASEATDLLITFESSGDGTTVRIVQTGWDLLDPEQGRTRRDRTTGGWATVTASYRELIERGT
jgi:hypothetical protein